MAGSASGADVADDGQRSPSTGQAMSPLGTELPSQCRVCGRRGKAAQGIFVQFYLRPLYLRKPTSARRRGSLRVRHCADLGDLAFAAALIGAEAPTWASLGTFASRAARRRAVFARVATLFALCSRIACAASSARRSFAAAAELGCTCVFKPTSITSRRSRKLIYSIRRSWRNW